jgi:YVTN family beta-propeller protein
MQDRRLLIVATALFGAAGCGNSGPSFKSNCVAGTPSADALVPAQRNGDGSVILPDGRKITPAGSILTIGGFPLQLKVLPQYNGRYVVFTDGDYGDEHLRIVDTQATSDAGVIVSNVDYPRSTDDAKAPALFYGLALSADGSKLYVSDGAHDPLYQSEPDMTKHYNVIEVYDIAGSPPQLTKNSEIHLMFTNPMSPTPRLPSGLALSPDGNTLYAACQYDGTLAVVDLTPASATQYTEIATTMPLGIGPYDVALDEASHTAFVSLWGGYYISADTFQDGVVPVDVANRMTPSPGELIRTDKAPEQAIVVGGKVYVANAGENAVVALDLDTLAILGKVPTAWYPTAVAVAADGSLVIVSARGLGRGPRDGTPEPDYADGTLQVVPRPSDDDLRSGSDIVAANLDRPHTLEAKLDCGTAQGAAQKFAVPAAPGAPAGLSHVFLIVKENKTYDGVLGDLAGGNGKADLVEFGDDVTPNAHALASQFVLLDNFYSHAELSVQGHEWTTGCIANDYTEKSWSHSDDYGRAYLLPAAWGPEGTLSRLATPGSGSIWHHLDEAGVAYHNYGEITNTGDAKTLADPQFPGVFFNTSISDVDKAQFVLDNLNDPNFKLEPFTYLLLPNDHTNGTSKGAQTPQSMVADNDEGLGLFIEGLSKTKYWKSSVVFVVEDDPGGTLDHVEEHRSLCYVASPWVKRGYRSSTEYDLGSVYHTIELILGVGPMNLNDAHAAAMYELFTDKPDFSPWTHIPRKTPIAYNSADAPLADESARIDFTKPDQADLTRILWKAVKGRDAEPPLLPARSKLDRDDDDD